MCSPRAFGCLGNWPHRMNIANLGRRPYRVSRPTSSPFFKIASDCCCGARWCGARVLERAGRVRGVVSSAIKSGAARPHRTSGHRAKGRFQRAVSRSVRERNGLPHESTISTEDFMTNTLDVWTCPQKARSASATLHRFPSTSFTTDRAYTYRGDVVLDPFLGSGSALLPQNS